MDVKDRGFTQDELSEFDSITSGMSSPNQLTRISARLACRVFVEKHGKEKCDLMFSLLTDDRRTPEQST